MTGRDDSTVVYHPTAGQAATTTGGDDSGGSLVNYRIQRLEEDAKETKEKVSQLENACTGIQTTLSHVATKKDLADFETRLFRWGLTVLIVATVSVVTVLVRISMTSGGAPGTGT